MQDSLGVGQIQIGLENRPYVLTAEPIQTGGQNLPSALVVQLKVADGLDTSETEIGLEDLLLIETSKIWIIL